MSITGQPFFLELGFDENILWVPNELRTGYQDLTRATIPDIPLTSWSRAMDWACMKWDGLAQNNSTAWFIEEDVGWSNPNVLRHLSNNTSKLGKTSGLMTVTAGNMINDPHWYFWKQLTDNEHLFPALFGVTRASGKKETRRESAHAHSFNVFSGLSGSLLAEIARFAERNARRCS